MTKNATREPGLFDSWDDYSNIHMEANVPPGERPLNVASLEELVSLALRLGASSVSGWSQSEQELAANATPTVNSVIDSAICLIQRGLDPLGDSFCNLLSASERRPLGAIYTPQVIVDAMLAWSSSQLVPDRVVDPGVGSARFLVNAGRVFPNAELIGVEIDPIAAIIARGHIAAAGFSDRTRIILADYRDAVFPEISGRTLYVGNPPYVRHHLISSERKSWLVRTAAKHKLDASQLSGLHVHFFLAIAEAARANDVGILITAAEWLDVNYGRLVRELLLGPLGGKTVHVIEPTAMPFPDTATTAVITGFEVGSRQESIALRRVSSLEDLGELETPDRVRRERLETSPRWSPLTRPAVAKRDGFVELGELCRVHRGQVTGKNSVWIDGAHSRALPESVLFRSVTRAKELFAADGTLSDASQLRQVIDIPADLDVFDTADKVHIESFLRIAKGLGADTGFIAEHRRAWWSVGLRTPAPILATYMARRPPAFVRNIVDARHINIAHGIYPRESMSAIALQTLADFLSSSTTTNDGRTYAGGLTKFEPREMERLMVPSPSILETGVVPPA